MADCIEDLRTEHRAVLLMLDIMGAMERLFDDGRQVPAEDADGVIDFLRTFVDRCHHGKEESLLFPAIAQAMIPGTTDLLERLEGQHQRGREYVSRMAEYMPAYTRGDVEVGPRIAHDIQAYADMLRRHISLEDEILFPAAVDNLPTDVQERLVEGYARIEAEEIGEGRHEAYHQMLRYMQAEYVQRA